MARNAAEVEMAYTKLKTTHNVPDSMLREKCSQKHTLAIEDFIQWRVVGPLLPRINNQKISDIDIEVKGGEDLKRRKLLEVFHQKNGNLATYEVLIKAMLWKEHGEDATKVFELLTPSGTPPVDDHPVVTTKPSGKPTLPKLLDLEIPAAVSDKYETFGIILLEDEDGKKMAVIKNDCHGEAEKITLRILKKWMGGDGMSVTWESLIIALRKCAPLLAGQIEISLKKH